MKGCLFLLIFLRVAFVSDFKLTRKRTICYCRDINKFVRYRTRCKSILKCGFPTKGIELTQFVLFEVLGVPQLWAPWFRPFRQVSHENSRNTSEAVEQEIFACLISWWDFVFVLNIGCFPFHDDISPYGWKYLGSQGSLYCTTSRSDTY